MRFVILSNLLLLNKDTAQGADPNKMAVAAESSQIEQNGIYHETRLFYFA